MRLLLDEMYPPALGELLAERRFDAVTAAQVQLGGAPDSQVLAVASAADRVVVTENVSDFARLAAELAIAGGHHPGVLIALSSRFSRRPAGLRPLVDAIAAIAEQDLADRVIYLSSATGR